MYKLDLHTHSELSPDGALKAADYKHMLKSGRLDYIAVTDHNEIEFAVELQKELGDRIIVGEEIMTPEGEIIGLFLKNKVQPGMPPRQTMEAIHAQGGLVCVPHPFESLRKGLQATVLEELAEQIDIIEVHNGRVSIDGRPELAQQWSLRHGVAPCSNSDAHGRRGWGRTYSIVAEPPTAKNLVKLLNEAELMKRTVGAYGRFYPMLNRMRKRFQT